MMNQSVTILLTTNCQQFVSQSTSEYVGNNIQQMTQLLTSKMVRNLFPRNYITHYIVNLRHADIIQQTSIHNVMTRDTRFYIVTDTVLSQYLSTH